MQVYLKEANTLIEGFEAFQIEAIIRESNQVADALSKYTWKVTPLQVDFVESDHERINQECINVNKAVASTTPVHAYLES